MIIGYKSSFGFLDTIEKLGFQKTELFIGAILEYLMESGMKKNNLNISRSTKNHEIEPV